jgi:hypothetical protein
MSPDQKAELAHKEKLKRKYEKLDTLQALLKTHELCGTEPDQLTELKSRIRRTATQLQAMGGD